MSTLRTAERLADGQLRRQFGRSAIVTNSAPLTPTTIHTGSARSWALFDNQAPDDPVCKITLERLAVAERSPPVASRADYLRSRAVNGWPRS